MNKQLILGIVIGVAVAGAVGAFALREKPPEFAEVLEVTPIKVRIEPDYAQVINVVPHQGAADEAKPEYANVLAVKPLKERGASRQVCRDHVVTRQKPVQDEHRVAGTATGAIIGGLLGSKVGDGNGQKAATVVGAVAGGYAGNRIQNNMQQKDTYQTTEKRCSTVRDDDRITAYQVTFELKGRKDTTTLDYKPGKTLTLVNGQIVDDTSQSQAPAQPKEFDVTFTYKGIEDTALLNWAPSIGSKFPVDNGAVDFNAKPTGKVILPKEEIRGYDVVYRIPGESHTNLARVQQEPAVGSHLRLKDGKLEVPPAAPLPRSH